MQTEKFPKAALFCFLKAERQGAEKNMKDSWAVQEWNSSNIDEDVKAKPKSVSD